MTQCNSVLVITDHLEAVHWVDIAASLKNTRFSILNLGWSPSYYRLQNVNILSRISNHNFIHFEKDAESVQEYIRSFFPKMISELPATVFADGKTLSQTFSLRGRTFWWFLDIAEKNPLKLQIIHQLYYMGLIKRLMDQNSFDETWVSIEDKELRQCIETNFASRISLKKIKTANFFKKAFSLSPLRFLKRYSLVKLVMITVKELINSQMRRILFLRMKLTDRLMQGMNMVAIFTHYPVWWLEPFSEKAKELFWSFVWEKEKDKQELCFVSWTDMNSISLMWRYREVEKAFLKKCIVPLETFLSAWELFVINCSSELFRIAFRFRYVISKQMKIDFMNLNVSNLIIKEIQNSLSNGQLLHCFTIERACEILTSSQNRPKAILYRNEFQPYERALLRGVGKRVRTIGFQHSSVGPNHMPYYFDKGEIEETTIRESRKDSNSLPLPDYFILTGEEAANVWKDNGFSTLTFSVVGPVRYPRLCHYQSSENERSEFRKSLHVLPNQKIITISLSILRKETLNLIALLLESNLNFVNNDVLFLFKCHPLGHYEKEVRMLLNHFRFQANVQFLPIHSDLFSYLKCSDALFSCGSTTCLEAIAMGVIPIVYGDNSLFSYNPMLGMKEAVFLVHSPHDLSEAIKKIIRNDNESFNSIKQHWANTIARAFKSLDEKPIENVLHIVNDQIRDSVRV